MSNIEIRTGVRHVVPMGRPVAPQGREYSERRNAADYQK